jgi:hypothetical protein
VCCYTLKLESVAGAGRAGRNVNGAGTRSRTWHPAYQAGCKLLIFKRNVGPLECGAGETGT